MAWISFAHQRGWAHSWPHQPHWLQTQLVHHSVYRKSPTSVQQLSKTEIERFVDDFELKIQWALGSEELRLFLGYLLAECPCANT